MTNAKIKAKNRFERLQKRLTASQQRLEKWLNWRLSVGAGIFVSLVLISAFRSATWPIIVFVGLSIVLIAFIGVTRRIRKFNGQLKNWCEYLERQTKRQLGQSSSTTRIGQAPLELQALCEDLQLLGSHSVMGMLDETISDGGQSLLKDRLLVSCTDKSKIEAWQERINKLALNPWALEKFVLKNKIPGDTIKAFELRESLKKSPVSEGFSKAMRFGFLSYFLAWSLTGLCIAGIVPLAPATPVVVYFLIVLSLLKHTADAFNKAQDYSISSGTLHDAFMYIESNLKRDGFGNHMPRIDKVRPTLSLAKLEGILSALSARANPIVYGLMNILFPWDLYQSWRLENWRKEFSKTLDGCLEELFEFEYALCGALVTNYHSDVFAELTDDHPKISFTGLFHPLIDRANVIANDYELGSTKKVGLITGSNMSGKSTFLRTIGVNQKLALMGFPVFAKNFQTFLGPVRTCLHVTDSLSDGFSTFYAEVRKIAQIMKAAEKGERFLFLIDEIFRGTNNRERLQGSQSVIAELTKHDGSIGLVTTHDLELSQMEQDFDRLGNWHFSDDVHDGKMSFPYDIRTGPCPTTNALRIMAMEGLPVK